MLYVTDAIGDHLPAGLDRLKRATGIDEWVGSVGIGICATGREYFDEPAAAVMIADLDQQSYRVFETIRDDLGEFSRSNGAWIARAPAHFGIVHADPRNQRTGDIVADLADELDGFLVGGLSSSRAVPAHRLQAALPRAGSPASSCRTPSPSPPRSARAACPSARSTRSPTAGPTS